MQQSELFGLLDRRSQGIYLRQRQQQLQQLLHYHNCLQHKQQQHCMQLIHIQLVLVPRQQLERNRYSNPS